MAEERRVLLIIETILKAESALAGLAKLEASLAGIIGTLKAAGVGAGLDDLIAGLQAAGESRRGLEALAKAFSTTAGAAPKAGKKVKDTGEDTKKAASAWKSFVGRLQSVILWLRKVDQRLGITRGSLSAVGRVLRSIGGFFLTAGKSILQFINPLRIAQWVLGQFTRAVRIFTALLMFQAFRKLEEAVVGFVDSLIGANSRVELLHQRMSTLIGDSDRAKQFFGIVRDEAIGAGVALDQLAQSTFRFASVSGKNMEVFQELVKRTIALAFYDPQQGLAGAGLAIMEALTGQFRSLVKRFEIGTMEMASAMRRTGMTNLEIIRTMMEQWGVGVDLITDGADTMARMWETMKSQFRELARVLGLPIWDYFKSQLTIARDWVVKNRDELEALAGAFGTVLTSAVRRVGDLLGDFMGEFSPDSWFEWGLELIYSFSSGLLSGVEFLFSAVTSIAGVVADFLMAFSPPRKGPLRNIIQGGAQLIREWIRGMESADLSAITDIAGYVASALSLLEARGTLSAQGVYEWSKATYEALTQAMKQLRDFGELSSGMVDRLRDLFGELFGDVEEYLRIYDRILEIQAEIEAREAAVEAVEELIKAQEIIIRQRQDMVEAAREGLRIAQEELEAFRKRTRGIPARFTAQRERELEAMVDAKEAEVAAREERLKAAQEEMRSRREQLDIAREFLNQAKEQQQAFKDQLAALKAQMSMMEKLWALERQSLKDAEQKRQIGIDEAEDLADREARQKKIAELSAKYLDIMREKFAPLRERFDALLAGARALFMYDEAEGLEGTIAKIEEALGRKLTPAEREAVEQAVKLRENLDGIGSVVGKQLPLLLDFASGLLGLGEGEGEAYEKGETWRKSLETLWNDTLKPMLTDIGAFMKGLFGIGEQADSGSESFFALGQLWRQVGGIMLWILENVIAPILRSPITRTILAWVVTLGFLLSKLSFLIPVLQWVAKAFGWVILKLGGWKVIGLFVIKVISSIVTAFGGLALGVKLAILAVIAVIASLVYYLLTAKGTFKERLEAWWEAVKGIFEKIKEVFTGFLKWLGGHSWFTDLKNAFRVGIDDLITSVLGFVERFLDIGKEIIGKIIEGVQARWTDLLNLIGNIRDLWPFSPAKEGPFSKPMHWEFLTEGLVDELHRAEAALSGSAAFTVGPVPMGTAGITPMMGSGLVHVEITNNWDASISGKDRQELAVEMRRTTYNAMDEAFRRVRS